MREWFGREEGSVTTEVAVLFPIMLILMFAAVQTGMLMHAKSVAGTAASQGAAAAASSLSENREQAEGSAVALAFANTAGGIVAPTVSVTVNQADQTVTVTVSGTIPAVIPGGGWAVHDTVVMPLERYQDVSPS